MQLIATQDFRCRDVNHKKGEVFELNDYDAKPVLTWGFARKVEAGEEVQSPDVDALRSRYRTLRGREPDMRWGIDRLQRETASVGSGTYGRRDMRAED